MQIHSVTPNACGLKAGLWLFILSRSRNARWRLLRKAP